MATTAKPNSNSKFFSFINLFVSLTLNLDSRQQMYGVPVKFADDLFSTVCIFNLNKKSNYFLLI
jgi:hypothetical protein